MDSSMTKIADQLLTAVRQGNPINSILLNHQDAKKELTHKDIEGALNYIVSHTRQFDPYPLHFCNLLYESLSESEKQKMRAVVSKRTTGLSPLRTIGGRIEIAQWLVEKVGYNVNQVFEWNYSTPLSCAASGLQEKRCKFEEMCIFLLEHGAIPANNDAYQLYAANSSPLYFAVKRGNKRIVHLLLDKYHVRPCPVVTNCAISYKRPAILTLLFQYGDARVVYRPGRSPGDDDYYHRRGFKTVLNQRINNNDERIRVRRYALVNICRILVNHAKTMKKNNDDDDTTALLLSSIVDETDKQSVKDYIDAGLDKQMVLLHAVHAKKQLDIGLYFEARAPPLPDPLFVCQWLVELGADPFLADTTKHCSTSWSPFQLVAAASSHLDTDDLLEDDDKISKLRYFLKHWYNERFASNGGQNMHGDSPIHVLCRYPHVSLQAIQLLVQEFDAIVSEPTTTAATPRSVGGGGSGSGGGGEQNQHTARPLLPFHLTVMSDAELDVIYYLLRQYPDALID